MKAAQQVELTDYLQRRPKELSGGQRQRVALARAIVRQPAVFLMDEPLSNLDAKLRVTMRAHIKHLHHTLGVTTIYVTHDQIEAMTLADRVVVMSRARVQQIGTPQDIYDRPANLFVAGFIGSPPMNLLKQGSVVLGVRPEDLRVLPADTPGALFSGEVFTVELTGDSTYVTLKSGEQLVTAKEGKQFRAEVGQRLAFGTDPARCHRFDAKTELRLPEVAA